MSESFDPYLEWLKIPAARRPPSHYDMLGLRPFEPSAERIHQASLDRTNLLRQFMLGPQATDAHRLSTEVSAAYAVLSDTERKLAYDNALRPQGDPRSKESKNQETPIANTPSDGIPQALPPVSSIKLKPVVQNRYSKVPSRSNQGRVWIALGIAAAAVTVLGSIVAVIFWISSTDSTTQIAGEVNHEFPAVNDDKPPAPPQPERPSPGSGESSSVPEASKSSPDGSQAKQETPQKPASPEAPKSESKSEAGRPIPEPRGNGSPIEESPPRPMNSADPRSGPATAKDNEVSRQNMPPQQAQGTAPKESEASPSANVAKRILVGDPFPSGRVFSLSLFDVQSNPPKENDPGLVVIKRPNGSLYAIATQVRGTLEGVAIGEHENKKPMVFVTYHNGHKDGILKTWDESGRPVLFSRYKSGQPHGFRCYFEDGKLRLLYDYTVGRVVGLRLIQGEEVLAEFLSESEAADDPAVSVLIKQMDDVEETIAKNEAAFRKQVKQVDLMRRRQYQSAANAQKNSNILNGIARQGAQDTAFQNELLRRAYSGRW